MTRIAHVPGFDTLSYARRLKAAGVDEAQAEAHAEAVRDAVTEGVATKDDLDRGLAAAKVDLDTGLSDLKADVVRLEDRMATKDDVAALRAEMADLRTDMADLKAELKTDVANLGTRLIRFVFAAAAGQVALIVGLLKLIP